MGLKNGKVTVNEEGNIVIEVLTNIKHDVKKWDNIDYLKSIGRMYVPEEGQRGKPALWVAEFEGSNPYRKYEEVNVNGITMKVTLGVKIEEKELNRIAEYKTTHIEEVNRIKDIEEKENLKNENEDLKERLEKVEKMMAKLGK